MQEKLTIRTPKKGSLFQVKKNWYKGNRNSLRALYQKSKNLCCNPNGKFRDPVFEKSSSYMCTCIYVHTFAKLFTEAKSLNLAFCIANSFSGMEQQQQKRTSFQKIVETKCSGKLHHVNIEICAFPYQQKIILTLWID